VEENPSWDGQCSLFNRPTIFESLEATSCLGVNKTFIEQIPGNEPNSPSFHMALLKLAEEQVPTCLNVYCEGPFLARTVNLAMAYLPASEAGKTTCARLRVLAYRIGM
jgi:hypothetical protein